MILGTIFSVVLVIMAVTYAWMIHWIYQGWSSIQEVVLNKNTENNFSIIIPARNEATNIKTCILSILDNDLPTEQYEIIVVDDHSTDNTVEIVQSIDHVNVVLVSQKVGLSGKKAAVDLGISHAKYDRILSTDADCIVSNTWMQSHEANQIIASDKFYTGIVLPIIDYSILSRFQWLDFAASMAITANGIKRKAYFLANGANMSYTKSSYYAVGGYADNQHLASGDDVFLVNKIASTNKKSVFFLKSKSAYVETKSEQSWSSFIAQRKRWATKALQNNNAMVAYIQSFVFVFSFSIFCAALLSLMVQGILWIAVILALGIKMMTDYLFLNKLAKYYSRKEVMKSFIACFFIYFLHIFLSAYFALFPSSYSWKQRKTN